MRRTKIYTAAAILTLIVLLLIYHYVFSIYEVVYSVNPESLVADNRSTVTITAVPLNSFGKKVPLRNVEVKFGIREGNELVELVSVNENKGYIVLRALERPGTVIVTARSNKSLLPAIIEVRIYPPFAENKF